MISGVSPETRRSRKFDTANQGDLKIPLYSNAIRDERVRDYLPVRRVMLAERVEGSMSLADKAQLEEVDRQRSSK